MLKIILFLLFLNLQTILALYRKEISSIKPETDRCRGEIFDRWYFNKTINTREQFVFDGCGGNGNSFASKKKCPDGYVLQYCPDISTVNLAKCAKYFNRADMVEMMIIFGRLMNAGKCVRTNARCHR